MKKTLLLPVLFLISLSSFGQSWIVQASNFPQASTGVYDFAVTSETDAWALAYDGSGVGANYIDFTRTSDGGLNWIPGTVGADTNWQFSNISAIDANTAWVASFNKTTGNKGRILKTTDGGITWNQQGATLYQDPSSFLNVVHFWNANEGFAMGDPIGGSFEVYTTGDGGANWTRVPATDIPAPSSSTEYGTIDYYTVVGDHVWFYTSVGRIFHSTDKGHHWTVASVHALAASGQWLIVRFMNPNYGYAVVAATNSFVAAKYTNDGGATWTALASVPANLHKGDLIHIPGTKMMLSTGVKFSATADLGSSYSIDSGKTWTEFDSGIQHYKLGSYSLTATYNGNFSQIGGAGIFKYDGTAVYTGKPLALNNYSVYPNPSNGIITLNMKTRNEDVNILVVDALGRVTYQNTIHETGGMLNRTIDLSSLSKGVYSLVITVGNDRSQEKIVIQ